MILMVSLCWISSASACHRYVVWKYPWPQSCGVVKKLVRGVSTSHMAIATISPMTLPLPSMEWMECPQGGESLERIAGLRTTQ